jgi:tRNA(Ile)-lysidine synthase
LDHGIRSRSETDDELRFVQSCCSRLEVGLVWERLDPGVLQKRAETTGASLEETARLARYEFLRAAAVQRGCDWIALGHTADDQVETVLMRFFQGVDISGLSGIPVIRDDLIRPLIECSREEILHYLGDHDLTYVTDSTNLSTRHLRNAVRLELLPVAERIFPGLRGSVLSLSKKLARVRDYLEEESSRRLEWKPVREGYSISGELFLSAPGLLRLVSVTTLINTLGNRNEKQRIPFRFLSRIEEDEYLSSRRIVLAGYGIRLYWRGQELILSRDVVGDTEKGYFIEERATGRVWVPQAGLFFDFGSQARAGERCLFRSARAGDRITLRGRSKTVNALFAEWRVMKSEYWKIPIVEQKPGIVAVLGSLFGYEDRFSSGMDQGKALKSMVHRYDVEVE